jgi:hypothetical protein
MWDNSAPVTTPPPVKKIHHRPVYMSVGPAVDGGIYLFCSINFNRVSDNTETECLQSWPYEAIARARAALDEFELWMESQS